MGIRAYGSIGIEAYWYMGIRARAHGRICLWAYGNVGTCAYGHKGIWDTLHRTSIAIHLHALCRSSTRDSFLEEAN